MSINDLHHASRYEYTIVNVESYEDRAEVPFQPHHPTYRALGHLVCCSRPPPMVKHQLLAYTGNLFHPSPSLESQRVKILTAYFPLDPVRGSRSLQYLSVMQRW